MKCTIAVLAAVVEDVGGPQPSAAQPFDLAQGERGEERCYKSFRIAIDVKVIRMLQGMGINRYSETMLIGSSYDPHIVGLSIGMAIAVSYLTIALDGQLTTEPRSHRGGLTRGAAIASAWFAAMYLTVPTLGTRNQPFGEVRIMLSLLVVAIAAGIGVEVINGE